MDDDRAVGLEWRVREELAVRDVQCATVGHVDGEGSERPRLMDVAKLFDCHGCLRGGDSRRSSERLEDCTTTRRGMRTSSAGEAVQEL